MPSRLIGFVSEPLVQFAAIGLVIFAASRVLAPEPVDPNTILIGPDVQRDLSELFFEDRGRRPSETEMDQLVERYLMNEVLFREARDLQLDHGDKMVRERLVQRIRTMIYSGVQIEPASDSELEAWWQERRAEFDAPQIISFSVIGLDAEEEEARLAMDEVNTRLSEGGQLTPRDNEVTLAKRSRPQLLRLFGSAFVDAVLEAPTDRYVTIESPRGWQLVKLIENTPVRERPFEEVRNEVRGAWEQAQVQLEARAALDGLRAKYPVVRPPYDPELLKAAEQADAGGTASQ